MVLISIDYLDLPAPGNKVIVLLTSTCSTAIMLVWLELSYLCCLDLRLSLAAVVDESFADCRLKAAGDFELLMLEIEEAEGDLSSLDVADFSPISGFGLLFKLDLIGANTFPPSSLGDL